MDHWQPTVRKHEFDRWRHTAIGHVPRSDLLLRGLIENILILVDSQETADVAKRLHRSVTNLVEEVDVHPILRQSIKLSKHIEIGGSPDHLVPGDDLLDFQEMIRRRAPTTVEIQVHDGLGPVTVDRVAHREEELRGRKVLGDLLERGIVQHAVGRRNFSRDASVGRCEDSSIPRITPGSEEVSQAPPEIMPHGLASTRITSQEVSDVPPEVNGIPPKTNPMPAWQNTLHVEIVDLLDRGDPHIGMSPQALSQPGRSATGGADRYELGVAFTAMSH